MGIYLTIYCQIQTLFFLFILVAIRIRWTNIAGNDRFWRELSHHKQDMQYQSLKHRSSWRQGPFDHCRSISYLECRWSTTCDVDLLVMFWTWIFTLSYLNLTLPVATSDWLIFKKIPCTAWRLLSLASSILTPWREPQ
jgi:hypothetical protein